MIDRETPYLKWVLEAAVDIFDAYEFSTTPATLVASTETARVTRLALSILVVRHRNNVKLILACCKDTYVKPPRSIH